MNIRIKKLHPDAVVPKYATELAAGFDLVAIEDVTLKPGETRLVKTGLAVAVPPGYQLEVRPRSGVSLKTPLRVANAPGTVDADYRGEVCVIIAHTGQYEYLNNERHFTTMTVNKGDRIAQGVITQFFRAEFEEVESLDETKRGEGGFGSTGQ